ncbi:MAG TPA: BTAD domain-containing putative transcriptional regulator, partial [Gaiellaceae bacterium]|nr:BTAD domain-containing putative transcriptional regulator [Gaiellaceae bacterium]
MSASGRTDFRLLGSVEVVVDGRAVPLGGAKQRALLAVLLLHANEAVSRDFLIDQLWGERAPVSADHAIAVYVSRLRKVLEAHGAEETLRPVPGGYLLRIDAEQTDVGRFERALDEGRRALEAAPWDAADILRRALAQWRGEALSDVVFEPFATTEARRLEELRLTALETRIDADLAVGRHAELIGELRSLVDRHPLNERFRAQLMLALYRAGRQAGALEVYRKTRRFLLDELGLEPGTDLQRLEQAILRHDPELEAPTVTSPVRSAAPPRRGTVSVLFAAVSSSTPPGEQLDPESLHLVTARCFNAIQETIERHGGWMERYAGDALIGIFGVPALHEDDALRAVRAATDMRDALVSLNEELRRDRGTALELRVAVNTGRVLTGAEGSAVTGDAVNVAVGLGQLARAGEILIGEETLRLVWNAVRVEPVEPCSLEGRAEPVTAHRLIATAAGARAAGGRAAGRLAEVAMVGRHRQLERMRDTFARVVQERSCHLFTIVGAAGIGKSRLAAEFLASLSDVTVLSGRCLAYGEGVAYVPVVDVLRQLPDVTELALDDVSVAALGSLLGERQVATTPPEIADGVRKALQAVASEQPVVVLFDDIHCGEGPFLDLVEHVAEVSSDAPILLLCLARPELLERRPNWTGGALNATALLLESLSEEEAGALIGSLLGGTRLEREVLDEIRQWTQGNPLFIEEMVALAVASDDPGVTIPPTVEAVLAAHLDQIDPEEREVLEAGAVEGQLFHVSAIRALVPRATHVAARLDALVRKDLVRPAKPQLPGEEAFRFRHLLIRDTAYRALPKARRADLHELFSDWLDVHAADVVVVAELGGYHLEQAYRYRRELSPSDERVTALATRAAERLALAGRRAHRLGDVGATADLLRRARALCAVAPAALEVEFADALLWAGHPAEAEEVLDEAEARAAGKGNRSAELLVRLVRTAISWGVNPEGKSLELSQLAEEAVPVFEAEGCESGLMRAWIALGQCEHMHG